MDNAPEAVRKSFRFVREDRDRLEFIAASLGRCHDNINKIEQLHSMVDTVQSLYTVNSEMEASTVQSYDKYVEIQEHMSQFMQTSERRQG